MSFRKNILKSISEGVLNAISFDDELPSDEEIKMHKISNSNVINDLNTKLADIFLSTKIDNLLADDITHEAELVDLIQLALDAYNDHHYVYSAKNIERLECVLLHIISIVEKKYPELSLNWIDVSGIEDFNLLFYYSKYNGDISEWDVSNAKHMNNMFESSDFNKDISMWKIPSNCICDNMFTNAKIDNRFKPKGIKE